jgi:leucyl-tRNA synthetase
MAVIVSPYAPHLCEELWSRLGHNSSVEFEKFPEFDEKYLVEDEFEYPVSFNGKMRFRLSLPADYTVSEIEESVMKDQRVINQLAGNSPKKIIIVQKKIINIVS